MNKIFVMGNLVRNPEVSYTPTGQMVVAFAIASEHIYTARLGLKNTETQQFNCLTYGMLPETCNTHLKKGQQLLDFMLNIMSN